MPFLAPVVTTIGTAVAGAATWLGTTALGTTLLQFGLGLAAKLLQAKLQPKPKAQATQLEVTYGEDLARSVLMGTTATAGHHIYRGAHGRGNRKIQDVYVLSHSRIVGVTRVRYKGEWKNLVNFKSPEGYEVEGTDGAVCVRFTTGAMDQAADPFLVSMANPSSRWTANHRLAGVAYAVVYTKLEPDDLTAPAELLFEVQGAPLYDWRKDSSVGGSGLHRWANQATWEFSDNPAVMAFNLERGFFNGTEMMVGKGMATARLPLAEWTLAANICDELIEGKKRYRAALIAAAGQGATHAGNMEPLLEAMAASWLETAAGEFPIAGANQAVVATFTDADLYAEKDRRFSAKRMRTELVNFVAGTFPDPTAFYEAKPFTPKTDATLRAADGERLAVSIPFEAVPFTECVDRLADIALRASRYQANGEVCVRPKFLGVKPGQWVRWNSAKFGDRKFQVLSKRLGPLGPDAPRAVYLTLQEVGEGIFDPTAFTTTPVVPTPPGSANFQTELAGYSLSAVIVQDAGGARRPGVRALWTTPEDPTVTDVDFEYRPVGQPTTVLFDTARASALQKLLVAGLTSNAQWQVRYRLRTRPGRVVPWTAWVQVATSDARLGTVDLLDAAVTDLKLADAAVTSAKIALQAVTAERIAELAVTVSRIANGAVEAAKIASGAVTADKIAAGAVTVAKFASGLSPVEIVSSLPTSGNYAGRMVFLTGDGKLYRHTGSPAGAAGFTAAVPSVDITGQLSDSQIAAISAAKLTGQITATQITDGAISTPKLSAGSVTAAVIAADTITAAQIAAGAITASEIAAGSVTTSALAAGAVTANTIAANAITTGKIQAGAVTADQIAANAVAAKHLLITDIQNLVQNGAFTSGDAAGWDNLAGAGGAAYIAARGSAASTAINSMPGPFALIVQYTTPTFRFYANNSGIIQCAPGDQFLFLIDVARSGNVPNNSGQFRVQWQAADGTVLASDNSFWNGLSTTWQTFTYVATAPEGAVGLRPTLQFNGSTDWAATTGYMLVTNYAVRRMNNGALIVDGAITATKIAAAAIVAGKIAAGAIQAANIAAGAITTAALAANSVTAVAIAAGAVTADAILSNAVTAVKILAGAVTADKIAAGAIVAGKIAAGAITASEISAGTITADRIVLNGITTDRIALNALNASASGSGSSSTDSNSNVTLATVVLDNPSAATVMMSVTYLVTAGYTSGMGTQSVQFRIYNDTTGMAVFDDTFNFVNSAGQNGSISVKGNNQCIFDNAPAVGANTYRLIRTVGFGTAPNSASANVKFVWTKR